MWHDTAFGVSYKTLRNGGGDWKDQLAAHIFDENRTGLSELYNSRIDHPDSADYLIFIHDDVWINDFFITQRLEEAFKQFDVVGVVGNRVCSPTQPSWACAEFDSVKGVVFDDPKNLSGSIAQGKNPLAPPNYWGASPQKVAVMDGVFMAVNKRRLLETGTRFDPRFTFDFYDLDFCRSAQKNGLRLGTYPIVLTHQSMGRLGTERWKTLYQVYLEKWNGSKS